MTEVWLESEDSRGRQLTFRPQDIAAFDADFDDKGRIGVTLKNGSRASLSLTLATAHGFRSSFRDWASENGYARDLAERALAHTVSNQVEAAYHRTDLLEQRRTMMEEWAQHVGGGVASPKIVPLRGRKKSGR